MKGKRFKLKNYFPDLPDGWGLYNDKEIEEKKALNALVASKHYRDKFLSGDEEAIFDYVKNYDTCFREIWPLPDGSDFKCYADNNIFQDKQGRSWVIEQIEKWKAEGTTESYDKLKKLFKGYASLSGIKHKDISEDKTLFEAIKKRVNKVGTVTNAIESVSKKKGVSYETGREIYYKLKNIEKEFEEKKDITAKNLRLEFFIPTKGINIPTEYKEQFKKELSLYWEVELLRTYAVSFPHIRVGAYIYPDCRIEGPCLSLKEAISKVATDNNTPVDKLKSLYREYKQIEDIYFDQTRLNILSDL